MSNLETKKQFATYNQNIGKPYFPKPGNGGLPLPGGFQPYTGRIY